MQTNVQKNGTKQHIMNSHIEVHIVRVAFFRSVGNKYTLNVFSYLMLFRFLSLSHPIIEK